MSTGKKFSAYLVVGSTEPRMPVNAVLIEKGDLLERDWTVMDVETGAEAGAVGVRIARLCATCKTKHGRIGLDGHSADCGSDQAKEQAGAFIATEKRQRQAVGR